MAQGPLNKVTGMRDYTLSLYEKAMPGELSWAEKLAAAKEAGFDAVEISIDETEQKLARLDWDVQERIELLTLTRKAGVPIHSMCLSGHRKYPLGSSDPAVRARGLEIAKKAIDFACDLGISIIMLAGYDVYYEPSTEQTRALFEENLQRVTHWAAHKGVHLAFETMETSFMNTTKKAMHYVHQINSPYLAVFPDVGNVTNGTDDVYADIESGRGHIVAAHLKESKPGIFRDLHYGEGHVDFLQVTDQLRKMGVALYTAEFWYDPAYLDGNWRGALKEANDSLRIYLD